MHNYYNEFADLHQSFIAKTQAEKDKLTAESNALADEARNLLYRITENVARHHELVAIMGGAADDLMSNYNEADIALGNIKDALKDFLDNELPDCKVELFEGYCEYCGEELTAENMEIGRDGQLICTDCAVAEDEAEEVLAEE